MSSMPDEILNMIFSFLPIHHKLPICKKYNNEAKNIMKCNSDKIVKWYKSKRLKIEHIENCNSIKEVIRFLIVNEKRPKYSMYLLERIINWYYMFYNRLVYESGRKRTVRGAIIDSNLFCEFFNVQPHQFIDFYMYDNDFNPIMYCNYIFTEKIKNKIEKLKNKRSPRIVKKTKQKNFKKISKMNRNISFSKNNIK